MAFADLRAQLTRDHTITDWDPEDRVAWDNGNAAIAKRNDEMAREIAAKAPKDLLVVAVLKGSFMFAADLLRMYSRYAERRGWKVEVLDAQETDLGGYKSVTAAVKAASVGEPCAS